MYLVPHMHWVSEALVSHVIQYGREQHHASTVVPEQYEIQAERTRKVLILNRVAVEAKERSINADARTAAGLKGTSLQRERPEFNLCCICKVYTGKIPS